MNNWGSAVMSARNEEKGIRQGRIHKSNTKARYPSSESMYPAMTERLNACGERI